MTLSDCPICGRRELRGERSLHAFPTPKGDVLALACRRCGAELSARTDRVLRTGAILV